MSANPGYAKTLFDWLLEHGGLHFSSAMSGLLLGALRHESPPLEAIFVVARHLLIPFDSYVYEPLAEQLASRTAQCAKPEIDIAGGLTKNGETIDRFDDKEIVISGRRYTRHELREAGRPVTFTNVDRWHSQFDPIEDKGTL